MKVIVYLEKEGFVSVITPTGAIEFDQVARKDVPANQPYKIMNKSDIPENWVFHKAWELDISNPDGYGIGQQAWFIEQYNKEIVAINAEPSPQALIPASFEQAGLPEEFTEEQKQEAYAQLVAHVTEQNATALAEWEQSKAARIEQLNNMIAVQEAEMAA